MVLASMLFFGAALRAQDGGAVPLPTHSVRSDTTPDSLKGPPISPRRALFSSLLIPGSAQSRLNRPTASILFATVEIVALGMARKSAQDVREAERALRDSVVAGYTTDANGAVIPTGYIPSRFTRARVRARHLHYEDWIALIVFNHIIAGADAYVAAHLWDFKTNVATNLGERSATLSASIAF